MAEIASIDRDLSRLAREKGALEQTLYRVRKREISDREVTRANSINRVMVESAVLDVLRSAGVARDVRVSQLYMAAQRTVANIKRPTVASYLTRMQARGLIERSGTYGFWRITDAGMTAAGASA